MKNFTYENQGTNTYLVYKVETDDVLDNMSLGMLTNNKIPGLASALFTQMNDDKYVKYNISSLISANQLFYGTVNRKRLLSVFKGVADTMLALDDYMIDVNLVLLNLDYIFVDPSTYEVSMICLPVLNSTGSVSLYDFIKNIMFSTQFEQSENCDYVTKIINYLNSTPTFSLSSFKQFVDSLADNVPTASVVNTPVRPAPVTTPTPVVNNTPNRVETPVAKPVEQPPKPVVPPVVKNEPVATPPANSEATPQTKNMSLFYLMQHYNKENAAAYKAQKEAKKQAGKKAAAPAKTKPVKSGANADMGFAIPGQETPVVPATPVQPPQNAPVQNKPQAQPQPVAVSSPAANPAPVKQQAPAPMFTPQVPVFDDFDDDEGTVVIGVNQQERQLSPHLIRRKTGERIQINKPVFKIGRNSDLNDYNIQGNKFIGHCHCHIVTRDTDFYIVDDNTKNHTYVDGQMITGSIEVQISDGCIIRLADEDFEFKLY